MFLRRHRQHAGGETDQDWSRVKTVRTAKGPRHETGAHVGQLDALTGPRARGWTDLDALLEGRAPATQLELGQPPLPSAAPLWRTVHLRGLRVERRRPFGRVYLGLAWWQRLGLHTALKKLVPPRRGGGGSVKAHRNRAGRLFCAAARASAQSVDKALGGLAAHVALARKLALWFYRLLRYGIECVEKGLKDYESQVLESEARLLRKLAKPQGFVLLPALAKQTEVAPKIGANRCVTRPGIFM
jgi:hypothetical protein